MVDESREGCVLGIASEELVLSIDSDICHFGDEINNYVQVLINEVLCWWEEIMSLNQVFTAETNSAVFTRKNMHM